MPSATQTATKLLAKLVDGSTDATVERRFGSRAAQRALFGGMARSFDPAAAAGFEGQIVYELSRPATGAPARSWTIEVTGGRATARPGGASDANLTLSFQLADFMRIATRGLDPIVPVLQGRASVRGDFGLAMRLPQMFG